MVLDFGRLTRLFSLQRCGKMNQTKIIDFDSKECNRRTMFRDRCKNEACKESYTSHMCKECWTNFRFEVESFRQLYELSNNNK